VPNAAASDSRCCASTSRTDAGGDEGGNMVQVSEGGYLTTVYVPPMCPMPEVVTWGLRLFVRQTDSLHREGIASVVPIHHDT
jgi:hypothetical protein